MRKKEDGGHVLTAEARRALEVLCLGRPSAFWQAYLADKMPGYAFKACYDGRPVAEQTLDAVLAAIKEATRAMIKKLDAATDWEDYLVQKDGVLRPR